MPFPSPKIDYWKKALEFNIFTPLRSIRGTFKESDTIESMLLAAAGHQKLTKLVIGVGWHPESIS